MPLLLSNDLVGGALVSGGWGVRDEKPGERCGHGADMAESMTDQRIVDADQELVDAQILILRNMSPARKWEVAMELYLSARSLKAAGLRQMHPEWSEEMIRKEVVRAFAHGHA